MTLAEAQQEIVDEFAMFSDWQDRYEHLIELGKELPLIAPEHKTEENIVRGCQSRVWLHAQLLDSEAQLMSGREEQGAKSVSDQGQQDERSVSDQAQQEAQLVSGRAQPRPQPIVHFTADSDAMITKGLVALLVRVLNDRTPEEILTTPLTFIDTIGLREHLSPNRSNGLVAMMDQMKRFAVAYSTRS